MAVTTDGGEDDIILPGPSAKWTRWRIIVAAAEAVGQCEGSGDDEGPSCCLEPNRRRRMLSGSSFIGVINSICASPSSQSQSWLNGACAERTTMSSSSHSSDGCCGAMVASLVLGCYFFVMSGDETNKRRRWWLAACLGGHGRVTTSDSLSHYLLPFGNAFMSKKEGSPLKTI